jgi:hypothetical protein
VEVKEENTERKEVDITHDRGEFVEEKEGGGRSRILRWDINMVEKIKVQKRKSITV